MPLFLRLQMQKITNQAKAKPIECARHGSWERAKHLFIFPASWRAGRAGVIGHHAQYQVVCREIEYVKEAQLADPENLVAGKELLTHPDY